MFANFDHFHNFHSFSAAKKSRPKSGQASKEQIFINVNKD